MDALFLAKTSPWAQVRDLDDAKLREIVEIARKLMRRNRDGGPRRTRFGLDRAESVWVMERGGLPCHVCGTPLAQVDFEEHTIYYCPACQTGGRVLKDRRLSRLLR